STGRRDFLESMFRRQPGCVSRRTEYEEALDRILDDFPFDVSHRYSGTERDEQSLYSFSTKLITRYINAIEPDAAGESMVRVGQLERDQVDVLKAFVWRYVILNPETALLQSGQRKAIRTVFGESLRMARQQA